MTQTATGYQLAVAEALNDFINHGWGELTVHIESMKDKSIVKVVVRAGRHYVFFVKKKKEFSKDIF